MAAQQISGITATEGARVFAGENTTNNITIGNTQDLLPCASQAPFNAYGRENDPLCHPDTRSEVLGRIRAWMDGNGDRNIFWLTGWAGTGKSTIARTIAREVYDIRRWTASFFFSRGGGDISHGRKFVSTIALQLANRQPEFRALLHEVISKDQGVSQRILTDQWRELVAGPISRLNPSSLQMPLTIVVDALDECENESDIWQILQFLADPRGFDHIQLRILITSRPESHVRQAVLRFLGNYCQELVLHDMSEFTVDRDIAIFLRHSLPAYTVEDHVIERLVHRSAGLFIWAATACRFINEGRMFAAERLSIILQDTGFGTVPEQHLDRIYMTVLMQPFSPVHMESERERLRAFLRDILGSVAVLLAPLSTCSLGGLLAKSENEIYQTLEHFHSVLNISNDRIHPIRLHHPSFRDFLLDDTRHRDQGFWIDEQNAHRTLFKCCMKLLCSSLKYDVCDVRSPGTTVAEVQKAKVEQCLLPEVQYACLYWVQHLLRAKRMVDYHGHIQQFLEIHFLHWVEALAWIQKVSEAISSISVLESLTHTENLAHLTPHVRDMKRFLRYNRSVIEHAPLQLYVSALVFAPVKSGVRNRFRESGLQWVKELPDIQEDWSPLLQTLEGHKRKVDVITYSHNGKIFASGSNDAKIQIWDSSNGMLIYTLNKHNQAIYMLTFSHDDLLLLSGSADGKVHLWDMRTGHCLPTYMGTWSANNFSSDGIMVATQLGSSTAVEVWDLMDRGCLHRLETHHGRVDLIMFSPDGKTLATTSRDHFTFSLGGRRARARRDDKLRLWDVRTGECQHVLRGDLDDITDVAFSRDGTIMASSTSRKVIIWRVQDGCCLQVSGGHSYVCCLAFSPDGQILAFARYFSQIVLCYLSYSKTLETIWTNHGRVTDLKFSPNGKLLASAHEDSTICLWNPIARQCCAMLTGHTSAVNKVIFAPNGDTLASASDDYTVRFWDPSVRKDLRTTHHTDHINSISISPNGRLAVSASGDRTLLLWDLLSRKHPRILNGPNGKSYVLAFSSNSKVLASASSFNINERASSHRLLVWDTSTGQFLHVLEIRGGPITSIAFGPDDETLASSSDTTIWVWNLSTGGYLRALKTNAGVWGHTKTISYSKSRNMLAAGVTSVQQWRPRIEEHTVKIWNPISGKNLHVLNRHMNNINEVVFGPDGRTLASASDDKTIRLWDGLAGRCLQILQGHRQGVGKVCFAGDGRTLASSTANSTYGANYDHCIRTWDLLTGRPLQRINTFHHICSLSFLKGNRLLNTDKGVLALKPRPLGTLYIPEQEGNVIYIENEWITKNGQKLLWLPVEYRAATGTAVQGNTVILGYKSGQIFFLEIL